jgi:hypothetical protein
MHKIPNTSAKSSKTLHQPAIQVLEKETRRPIGLVPTEEGKFPEETSSKSCKWVMWSGDVQTCGYSEGQGCKNVTCGCLCRRRVVPVMDAFFPSPFLAFILHSFILLSFIAFFLFKS